jgi:crotonobetainyl-CoA:carnitine CoA-transferase CaiB-like acyl-CoA transferase
MVATGGGPSHPPRVTEWALADEVGGLNLAFGVVAALVARDKTGVGQQLQTSQLGMLLRVTMNSAVLGLAPQMAIGGGHALG